MDKTWPCGGRDRGSSPRGDTMKNQNAKIKMQNEKEKFKEDFTKRLIKFSIKTLSFSEKIKREKFLQPVANQLARSATSVGANVVEAKSSSSKRDYIRFFEIALKSANETKYWLILVRESTPKLKTEANQLLTEMNEISNIIGASILTLKGKR